MLILAAMLTLLVVANGMPILAQDVFGSRFAWPLDFGLKLPGGGGPVFGRSKTVRGVVVSLVGTTLAAWILGMEPLIGTVTGAGAMVGDLLSSFVKRRLGVPPSGRAFGLDQVPESLLPLLLVRSHFQLGWGDAGLVMLAFVLVDVLLSRVAYRLHLRRRPY